MQLHKILMVLLTICGIALSSCDKESGIICPEPEITENTLLMYFPWSVNLTTFFTANIADMEKSISENGLDNQRVVVFFASAPNEATMFEIKRNSLGIITRDTLKSYPSHPYTTAEGITTMLDDVKEYAPASNYSMIIGAHGMAWIPVNRTRTMYSTPEQKNRFIEHWNVMPDPENPIMTRYFGGTSAQYQTDISTLVQALDDADMHMRYILFDDCFMSSIEVAYELRHSTDYLIASTCEIMDYGMPYHKIGKYLLGTPDYEKVVTEFHNFYSTYNRMPCGTIGVTKTDETEALAAIMKEINLKATPLGASAISGIQTFDGYKPTIFFDLGHYVETLCASELPELYENFSKQLEVTVPYKAATETYYSMSSRRQHNINHYSGINTSAPSTNNTVTGSYSDTPWYKATH